MKQKSSQGINMKQLVTFVPKNVVEKMMQPPNAFLINIHEFTSFPMIEHWNHISFYFDDIESEMKGLNLFSEAQAQQIIEIVKHFQGSSLFVNCDAGVSRSAAVAKWINDRIDNYELVFHSEGKQTTEFYNRYVYNLLEKVNGSGIIGQLHQQEKNNE